MQNKPKMSLTIQEEKKQTSIFTMFQIPYLLDFWYTRSTKSNDLLNISPICSFQINDFKDISNILDAEV